MIVDTNALSAFLQNDEKVIEVIASLHDRPRISVVTGVEYKFGLLGPKFRSKIE